MKETRQEVQNQQIFIQDEEKNVSQSQKYSKFRRPASLHDSMFKLILHAKAKLEFTDNFGSHFIGRGLTNRSES